MMTRTPTSAQGLGGARVSSARNRKQLGHTSSKTKALRYGVELSGFASLARGAVAKPNTYTILLPTMKYCRQYETRTVRPGLLKIERDDLARAKWSSLPRTKPVYPSEAWPAAASVPRRPSNPGNHVGPRLTISRGFALFQRRRSASAVAVSSVAMRSSPCGISSLKIPFRCFGSASSLPRGLSGGLCAGRTVAQQAQRKSAPRTATKRRNAHQTRLRKGQALSRIGFAHDVLDALF